MNFTLMILEIVFLVQVLMTVSGIGNSCRGNTPFCSKECRQEQIDIDEAKEKSRRLSSSKRGVRQSETKQNSTPNKTIRTGTVAVS